MKLTPSLFLHVEKLQLLRELPLSDSHLGDNSAADLPTTDPYVVPPVQPMTGLQFLPRSRLSC